MKDTKKAPFFSGDFDRLAYRLTLIFALIVPALDTLILSPLSTAILANSIGGVVLYEIFSSIGELAVTCAFLCQCTLIVCAALADKKRLALRLFLLEALSFLMIIIVKPLVLWANAAIDEYFLSGIGSFALSDLTLSQIENELLVQWAAISYLMNVLTLLVVMASGYIAALVKVKAVRSTGRAFSHETLVSGLPKNRLVNIFVAIPSVVYLLSQLVYLIGDTVGTLGGDTPQLISTYVTIITPYAYLLLHVAVSYFICQYVAYVMISRLGTKTSKK